MQIGEVAELVGTTTRAIRHYHRIGLVPEPARRANGYRDYDVEDVLRLLRVRRLVQLGVRLNDAADLLREDDDRSGREVLLALDAELAQQQARLQERRDRLQGLLGSTPGSDPLRQPELQRVVAELRTAFPGSDIAALERQAIDLLSHVTPEQLPAVLAHYRATLADPDRMARAHEIDRRFAALAGLSPDDPEVEAVAQLMLSSVGPQFTSQPAAPDAGPSPELIADLLTSTLTPAQRRCIECLAELARAGAA